MKNNSLITQIPTPPPNTKGWPWTVETDGENYNKNKVWPKISIVTPSYNQGHYIEETIRSILLQNYPNLEYIIIDGGSTDNTISIIEKYSPWITYWSTGKDKGQADAINKGLEKCNGEIFNWINSDDFLEESALYYIGSAYQKGTTIAGCVRNFDDQVNRNEIIRNDKFNFEDFVRFRSKFHQPGLWFDHGLMKQVGDLPIEYTYYFDRIYLLQYLLNIQRVVYLENVLVNFRFHEDSKTNTIMRNKDVELVEFYKTMLNKEAFKKYSPTISHILYYQIIPMHIEFQWEQKYLRKNLITKVFTYLTLPLSYPKFIMCRFYYQYFKKKVLGM